MSDVTQQSAWGSLSGLVSDKKTDSLGGMCTSLLNPVFRARVTRSPLLVSIPCLHTGKPYDPSLWLGVEALTPGLSGKVTRECSGSKLQRVCAFLIQ